jgi:hypothetical protein
VLRQLWKLPPVRVWAPGDFAAARAPPPAAAEANGLPTARLDAVASGDADDGVGGMCGGGGGGLVLAGGGGSSGSGGSSSGDGGVEGSSAGGGAAGALADGGGGGGGGKSAAGRERKGLTAKERLAQCRATEPARITFGKARATRTARQLHRRAGEGTLSN